MEKYSSPHLRLHGKPEAKGKGPAKGKAEPEKNGGPMDGEHEHGAVEHVTKTHPGETQPHEKTGVHAVHIHHTGGGKFTTHTHMEDGSVQTDHHENAAAMHDHMHQQFPTEEGDDMQHDQNADNDTLAGGGSLANMSSLGGE